MSEQQVPGVPQLVASLEIVDRWRVDTEAEVDRQLHEIDDEEQRLSASIAELQRQLKAGGALREEVGLRRAELDGEQVERTRDAVLTALELEGASLEARAALYDGTCRAREARISNMLGDAAIAGLEDAIEQFLEAEPTLELLPAGYRKVLQSHHESVNRQLKPVFEAIESEPEPVDAALDGFSLVLSLDPVEGRPEALALIVPVPYETYARWSDRGEDLHALLAYRIIGAVAAALRAVGASDAPIQYAPYEGRLAVQVWLGDSQVQGDIREVLGAEIERIKDEATELRVARLVPVAVWLAPEAIVPDEDEDEDEDEEGYNG